ncbi:hypothetical protein MHU86_23467 [Fragilaria crotonensis]|nr:hypothetical protein MHU86_23467 [Fragilaria crotonensis]
MEIAMTRQHIDGTKYSNPGNLENPRANKEANIVAGRACILDRRNRRHLRTHPKTRAFTDLLRKETAYKIKHRIGDDEHNNCIIADKIDKDKIKPIEALHTKKRRVKDSQFMESVVKTFLRICLSRRTSA